ncbi:MAG: D-glycero-beta-D-manno-heptose 1,7-bisphosphate 7-phosphatase [Acidobacteriota bacterium]
MKKPAIFLDRDGVINRDRLDFIKSWEEFEFLPTALQALAILAKTAYHIVVVSNQSGVGRGLLSKATLGEIHEKMIERIQTNGGRIDGVFYCPHVLGEGCSCRKPEPGLFLTAAQELGIDLDASWSVGDRYRDVQAASRAGIRAILLYRELPDSTEIPETDLKFVRAADLLDATRIIAEGDF